ncbi:hypothetical protein ERO13_A04G023566v2 [Gossypium hirsutum]|uniref:DUF538 domain-containing protein n=6 Tax=Gossypium TaxID=3633 RepID=A0A2P5XPZ6_GOSBA|nr:uncharacterized protein LOC107940864 [Gossypium hirsutum]XP_017648387.1 uncharacterized protein LOC108488610 [Gossypium arboreum]KAB2086358.1 hypothetical protein ES319_A04G026000v1 [Gossypium barbadense]TYH21276.1 hypothetical protein ES288_A04G030800v1 [Gossypium darwinii]TYI32053.1 hypothetical protein ES332_A04G031300v1 [Gossypium tomentosum]TYJ38913.1 hypothetical protein E1A91_A04G027700v1 [Gossypium mustelinum]KAG4204042.1 hypothetical protein ERO13_A04G023566v2 [Gossypium hirsutum]
MAHFITTQKPIKFLHVFLTLVSLISPLLSSSPPPPSIHDLLLSRGLPKGLLPKEVKSYTLSDNGTLEVFLDEPCLTKYENRVFFDSVVRANLSYGSLIGVVGLSQEELFLWLPVKDIIVDDPKSGLILFDIGLAYKQLSLSLFEEPPNCKPQGILRNQVRKQKGFEALR